MDCSARHINHKYTLFWCKLHWCWSALDLVAEVGQVLPLRRLPECCHSVTNKLQHRRCLKSTILDRDWDCLPSLPVSYQSAEQRASTAFQELDLSLGSVV